MNFQKQAWKGGRGTERRGKKERLEKRSEGMGSEPFPSMPGRRGERQIQTEEGHERRKTVVFPR